MMRYKNHYFLAVLLFFATGSSSCQKEIDGLINNVNSQAANLKPKVGTVWTYRYYSFYPNGNLFRSEIIVHKAVSEETYGGETWLNVIDVATNTTVYLLKEKTGGLFQYTNNAAYLLCKDTALLNDSYNSFNDGLPETFVVKGIQDSLATAFGNLAVNYYEGSVYGDLIHKIWYDKNHWVIKKFIYFRNLSNIYYKRYAWYLNRIDY